MKTSNPIQDWVETPIPEKLWHYTSIGGFYGIATSKEIFATDSRFLNDREEIFHARKIADALIADYPEQDENGLPLKKAATLFIKDIFSDSGMFAPNSLQSFVASFSAAGDSLSQWRGYSRGTIGACPGFKIERTKEPKLNFDMNSVLRILEAGFPPIFARCVYDESKKRELLRYALGHIIDAFRGLWIDAPEVKGLLSTTSEGDRFVHPLLRRLQNAEMTPGVLSFCNSLCQTMGNLIQITALLKNYAFHEEEEWRLVVWSNVDKASLPFPCKFRTDNTTLMPYVAFPFESEEGVKITLTDLVLGPGSDKNAISASRQFLGSVGINLTPSFSAVPFRPQ